MAISSRRRRFSGHTNHTFYCSCGKRVSGNGGKQHFKREGHRRVTYDVWRALSEQSESDGVKINNERCRHGKQLGNEHCAECSMQGYCDCRDCSEQSESDSG